MAFEDVLEDFGEVEGLAGQEPVVAADAVVDADLRADAELVLGAGERAKGDAELSEGGPDFRGGAWAVAKEGGEKRFGLLPGRGAPIPWEGGDAPRHIYI